MDTESLLHEELKDGIFSSEPSISEDEAYDNIAPVSRCLRWKRYIYSPLAYGIVTFVYSLILIVVVIEMQALRLKGPGLIDSPARVALKYEPQIFQLTSGDRYFGEPSDRLEREWNDLLQYQNLYVEAEDMSKLGVLDEGVKLPNGGYYASMMVYHQLHCLKRIHHYFYEDHYFPNITDTEREFDRKHNLHCMDLIRQGLQCQGDITLLTMRWGKYQAVPLGNFSAPHECVNWDSLQDWSKERSLDMFAEGMLVHPIYGASFPGGQKGRIGVAEDE